MRPRTINRLVLLLAFTFALSTGFLGYEIGKSKGYQDGYAARAAVDKRIAETMRKLNICDWAKAIAWKSECNI